MARFDLSDAEWALVAPLLPNKPRGVPRVDDRRVVNGIFWVLRTGSPWRDLPERYGPYTTVYNRYNRWAKAGVWLRVFEALAILELIIHHGSRPHIPTQRNRNTQRTVDPCLYRQRNLVERFFNKIKHFRGIATRYHKLARNFLAAIALASIRLWLRYYESTT